jgi:hypothetical protein
VVEVRHASFLAPAFIALLRKAEVAIVFSEHAAAVRLSASVQTIIPIPTAI